MTPSLSDFPTELVLQIAHWLDYDGEINALSQANRRLYAVLDPLLYSPERKTYEGKKPGIDVGCASYAMEWATTQGVEGTARKALEAGEPPGFYWAEQAAKNGHEGIVRLLYNFGLVDWDPTSDGRPTWNRPTPLEEALRHGHESIVQFVLENGDDVNGREGWYHRHDKSPLVAAAHEGRLTLVKLLVEAGADRRMFDRSVDLAVSRGHTDVVRYFIERDRDIIHKSPYSFLTQAAKNGRAGSVQCLLDHGGGTRDGDGMCALRLAARFRHKDVVLILARHYNYPFAAKDVKELTSVACAAAACGLSEFLNEIISQGWKANSPPVKGFLLTGSEFVTPLALASTWGHAHITRLLLSLGADPDGGTVPGTDATDSNVKLVRPLLAAAEGGHTQVVSQLLDFGADIRLYRGCQFGILYQAARRTTGTLEVLIKKGNALEHLTHGDIQDAIGEAVRRNNAAAVQMFIDRDVDFLDSVHKPPMNRLAWLISSARKSTLDVLLQSKYAPRARGTREDDNFVHCAVAHGNTPVLEYLASAGFRHLNSPPPEVQAELLTRASTKGDNGPRPLPSSPPKVLKYLLDLGFNIDVEDKNGRTPLLAVLESRSHYPIQPVRNLLQAGANPCFRSARGECPLVVAVKKKDSTKIAVEVIQMLLEAAREKYIPVHVVEKQVEEALAVADQLCEYYWDARLLRPLRDWYWRMKYPVL